MKAFLITGLIAFLGFSDNEKTIKLSNNSTVVYNVDDKGDKNGIFLLKNSDAKLCLRGSYKGDQRTGDWYCFDKNGKILLRYNYGLKKLISLDELQVSGLNSKIVDKNFNGQADAKVAIPVCPVAELKSLVASQLEQQMPPRFKSSINTINAKVTVMVAEDGKSKYEALYVVDGYEQKTIVIPNNKDFEIEWIPASANGKTFKSEASFDVSFKIDPSDNRRVLWTF